VTSSHPLAKQFFDSYAAGEIDGVLALLAPDVSITYGNSGPISGLDDAKATLEQMYSIAPTYRHEVTNEWVVGRDIIVEAVGDYDLRNGKNLQIPSITVITLNAEGLVSRYSVYIDLTLLYAE
jgi:ketosteroid isomerase-like protein